VKSVDMEIIWKLYRQQNVEKSFYVSSRAK